MEVNLWSVFFSASFYLVLSGALCNRFTSRSPNSTTLSLWGALMAQYTFIVLRFVFSLITSLLLAWLAADIFKIELWLAFLVLAVGLPTLSWLNRLKNAPAHLAAAYLLNKQLVADIKRTLKRLPIKSPDEWGELQAFYDDDTEIVKYRFANPKTFAVAVRSEFAMLKQFGHILPAIQGSWVIDQTLNQLWQESASKE
jgi:hypothetical protein